MRVFVAGGTGVVGRRLVPALEERGHAVTATTRSEVKTGALREAGAAPVVLDALDAGAVEAAVVAAAPDVVVGQLTDLSAMGNLRRFDAEFATTNRLRSTGTDNLLAGARSAGAGRVVVQSFTGWPYPRDGRGPKTEDDPLDPDPFPAQRSTLDAIRHLERAVGEAGDLDGLVLRYGFFYGPGTSLGAGGVHVDAVRKRRFPMIGSGEGRWSFAHIADVVSATVAAVEGGPPGLYNVVDDDPAPVREWLPALADAVGAKPPRHVPEWVGRLAVGPHGVALMTQTPGVSNAKARSQLGWQPAYPSWREGFRTGIGG